MKDKSFKKQIVYINVKQSMCFHKINLILSNILKTVHFVETR